MMGAHQVRGRVGSKPSYSPETLEAVLDDRAAGMGAGEIGKKHDLGRYVVENIIKRAREVGDPRALPGKTGRHRKCDRDIVLDLLGQGLSTREVARRVGASESSVRRARRRAAGEKLDCTAPAADEARIEAAARKREVAALDRFLADLRQLCAPPASFAIPEGRLVKVSPVPETSGCGSPALACMEN